MPEDFDPIDDVDDEPLHITPATLDALREFQQTDKLTHLPGTNVLEEKARLTARLDALTTSLLAGVQAHPSKLWVMQQFQQVLREMEGEDTEAREHFGMELEEVMDILGIEFFGWVADALSGRDLTRRPGKDATRVPSAPWSSARLRWPVTAGQLPETGAAGTILDLDDHQLISLAAHGAPG